MVNYTEKWKKGELEQGWYYANNDGERIIIYIFEKNGSVLGDDFDLKATDWIKPIAPVPSLEQWQQMKAFCEEFNALNVAEENQRLKELLKNVTDECDIEKQKALLKINELSGLLKECGRQLEEVELCRYDVADVDQEDWFKISTEQAGIAKKMKTKIDEALK